MKDRADYARKGIARGRALIAMTVRRGDRPRRRERVQHPAQDLGDLRPHRLRRGGPVQRVRPTARRRCATRRHEVAYSFSRDDVDARTLANQYAQSLGQVFTHEMKPMEVEILVAEIGHDDRRARSDVPHPLRRHRQRRNGFRRARWRGRGAIHGRFSSRVVQTRQMTLARRRVVPRQAALAGPDRDPHFGRSRGRRVGPTATAVAPSVASKATSSPSSSPDQRFRVAGSGHLVKP